MRKYAEWVMVFCVLALGMFGLPGAAQAELRLGVDGLWMPLSFQTLEADAASLDPRHEMGSFGVSLHGSLGLEIFSMGLKLNYFNQSVSLGDEDTRQTELDINLLARVGVPETGLGFFVEAGPTTNPGFDYVGYNVGGGVMYDVLDAPLFALNLGLMGQYVNVAEYELTYGGDIEATASLSEGRVMLFVGFDFVL